jgi:hypothetical protein
MRMPGISAGKSFVFRVTKTRPRVSAVANITASGDFSLGLSRRRDAARVAISSSSSSIPKPDKNRSARLKPSPEPLERTSIQTIRLTHTRPPRSTARRNSVCACGKPRNASMIMLLSKAKPVTLLRAFSLAFVCWHRKLTQPHPMPDSRRPASFHAWHTKPYAVHALGHLPHRKDRGTPLEPLHSPHPKDASTKPAHGAAIHRIADVVTVFPRSETSL